MYVFVFGCVHIEWGYLWSPQNSPGSLEVKVALGCWTWGLRAELQSSARAVGALHYWVTLQLQGDILHITRERHLLSSKCGVKTAGCNSTGDYVLSSCLAYVGYRSSVSVPFTLCTLESSSLPCTPSFLEVPVRAVPPVFLYGFMCVYMWSLKRSVKCSHTAFYLCFLLPACHSECHFISLDFTVTVNHRSSILTKSSKTCGMVDHYSGEL